MALTVQVDTVAALNAGVFSPGTTVQLKRGNVYAGPLTFSQNGTAGNPITITSYGDTALPQPQITGNSTLYTDALTITGAYIVLDHLLFTDTNRAGVYIGGAATNVTVQNCEMTRVGEGVNCPGSNVLLTGNSIHDLTEVKNTVTPTNDDYGANGFVLGGNNIEVSFNLILRAKAVSYDYGYDGGAFELFTSAGGSINNVSIHDNYIEGCDGILEGGGPVNTGASINGLSFYNNICLNNGGFAVFHNAGGSFGCTWTNVNIYNNTFVEELNQSGVGDFLIYDGSAPSQIAGFKIYNNIIYMNNGKYVFSQYEINTHYNNCFFFGVALASGGSAGLHIFNTYQNTLATGEFIANPLFVDQAARDFRLQSGSPATGMGGNAAAFNTALTAAFVTSLAQVPLQGHTPMAFPTLAVTPGTGATINTMPNAGQANMAGSMPVTMASDQPAMAVSATSLPLPTGAGTAANQSTMITSLGTIATNTPAVGQKASAASVPVVIASDQPPVPVAGNVAKFQAQFGPGSSVTYAVNQIMSAPIQVTGMGRVAGGSGIILGAELALNVANYVEVDLVVMTSTPTGTYTAGSAYPNVAADRLKISQVIKVTDWSVLSTTDSVGENVPASKIYTCDDGTNTQSLWVIPVARGSITLAAATDATLTLRASRN